MTPFDTTQCMLGEGAFWHQEHRALFWFDIVNRKMLAHAVDGAVRQWSFDEYVSAAGVVDRDHLLIGSQTALLLFNLSTGESRVIAPLEAENAVTRANDGRADPFGGFWIGTMGIKAEPGAGAIYRYYRGELRKVFAPISITNAICFAPGGTHAYFTDSVTKVIQRVPLDAQGWPVGRPEPFIDMTSEGLIPDGAVVDATGHLWCAQWGAFRVARYAPSGAFVEAIDVPAARVTCPAFGGEDFGTLFVTSAREGLATPTEADGQTFAVKTAFKGIPEPRVIL